MGLVEELFRQQPGQPSAKFDTIISRSTVVGEAQKLGKTIFQTHATHKVTDQYRALAQEVENRLEQFVQAQAAALANAHQPLAQDDTRDRVEGGSHG
jgi:nitrogenase subunit NifH